MLEQLSYIKGGCVREFGQDMKKLADRKQEIGCNKV